MIEPGKFKLAFSGTRKGMTALQSTTLYDVLKQLRDRERTYRVYEFHHGDCVGADDQAHELAKILKYRIYVHPCDIEEMRAFNDGYVIHPARAPLVRNKNIVRDAHVLIACPEGPERTRSGTWSTIRFAVKSEIDTQIIYPNGTIEWRYQN